MMAYRGDEAYSANAITLQWPARASLPLSRIQVERPPRGGNAGMRRSAPALVLDRRLQRQRHAEKAAVVAVAADDHQPHGCRARRLDRQRDGAAVEEVDDGGIAQQAAVEAPVILVLVKRGDG